MKLHESQRSAIAERIVSRWISRRQVRMARPKIYLIVHPKAGSRTWGWCHHGRNPYITLHVGPHANKRDQYILLAHEFAHALDWATSTPRWRRENLPHGERFQRLLWRTLPRGLWNRASSGRWIISRSAHKPQYQPIPDDQFENVEVAA